MLQALGAATSALELLKSLTTSKSQAAGNKQATKNPFEVSGSSTASESSTARSGSGSGSPISPATMSALLHAQGQATSGTASTSRSNALKDLFAQIDDDSDGKLSKSEFENALGAGGTNLAQAGSVFGKLDKDADGAVSLGEMMSALKGKGSRRDDAAAASTSGSDPLKELFAQIDADGDGKLSKSEFESALGAGGTNLTLADRVFGKLDKDGDGAVSLDEMMSALQGKGDRRDDTARSGTSSGLGKDPLMQALQGASSTSVTNSDGSVTTSRTYADGSRVTTTSAVANPASSVATSSYNLVGHMLERQTQAVSSAVGGSLSVSA